MLNFLQAGLEFELPWPDFPLGMSIPLWLIEVSWLPWASFYFFGGEQDLTNNVVLHGLLWNHPIREIRLCYQGAQEQWWQGGYIRCLGPTACWEPRSSCSTTSVILWLVNMLKWAFYSFWLLDTELDLHRGVCLTWVEMYIEESYLFCISYKAVWQEDL